MSAAASRARIAVLLEKELRELLASPMLAGTMALVPLLFGSIALGIGWTVGRVHERTQPDPEDLREMQRMLGERIAHFTDVRDALALYFGEMGLLLLLMLPAILPPVLASQTLVREKQARSLETLLVTPVRTWEIVVAKMAFCAGLGVGPFYVIAAAYYALLVARCPAPALAVLAGPGWLLTVLAAAPLIAVLGVGIGIAISSRAKDVQAAQQLSGMIVLPVVGLLVLQSVGLASLDGIGALVFVGALLVLDTVILALAIALFERETVVTRWS
jgi:ABC-2 type transport system permease protein